MKDNQKYKNGRQFQIEDYLQENMLKTEVNVEVPSILATSELEERAKSIFKNVVVQRCIVHLIRNSIKYIPTKSYKAYTQQLKKAYGAASLKAAEAEFERFKQAWSEYSGAIQSWIDNWEVLSVFFKFSTEIRKIMYTTNAIESLNSTYKRINRNRNIFPTDMSLLKVLYLSTLKAEKKWSVRTQNWDLCLSQFRIMY